MDYVVYVSEFDDQGEMIDHAIAIGVSESEAMQLVRAYRDGLVNANYCTEEEWSRYEDWEDAYNPCDGCDDY